MPDEKKIDPFKPPQPSIPGVAPSDAKAKPDVPPSPELPGAPQKKTLLPTILIASAAVSALLMIAGLISFSHRYFPKTTSASTDTTEASAAAPAVAPKPAGGLAAGPGPVATTEELAKPWSSKRFLFRNYVTGQPEPAMVVRLPRGDYWGFSLVEPFGNCELEFVTDLNKLRTDYHFRSDHPMVVDSCNHTVYDLLGYAAGASNDELVRGVIVQGNGIRPPMAIEIRVDGKEIVAVREE